jgi:hypothetical protein
MRLTIAYTIWNYEMVLVDDNDTGIIDKAENHVVLQAGPVNCILYPASRMG